MLRNALLVALVIGAIPAVAGVVGASTAGVGQGDRVATVDHAAWPNASAPNASADALVRTVTLGLTPDDPGSIEATVRFDVPDRVTGVRVTVPSDATVTATRGFDREEDREYRWDGSTARPSVTFDQPANVTGDARRSVNVTNGNGVAESTADDTDEGDRWAEYVPDERAAPRGHLDDAAPGYVFVDAGDWAVVQVPQLATGWQRPSNEPEVTLDRRTEIAGEGATGGEMAYLGPYEDHVRETDRGRIRLVVPEAASMAESPDAVLDSVAATSDRLRVGANDAETFFVAVPTDADWGPLGLQYGPDDAWVRADSRLASPNNVWIHEYVHTQQDYATTAETDWTIEASAEYYSALFAFEQGEIGFDRFRDHLRNGQRSPFAGAVLADPSTWRGNGANYVKGALVVGAVDYTARVESDRRRSYATALRRLNEHGQVDGATFYAAVNDSGGPRAREVARRYATTDRVPTVWGASEHATAFDAAPAVRTVAVEGFRVEGQYRNRSVAAPPPLAAGERLTATVAVGNDGGRTGEFVVALTVDGERVAARSVTVTPGARRTVDLTATFDEPGEYAVAVAGDAQTVTVREPAAPTVTALRVEPSSPTAGEPVRLVATVENDADVPADGAVEFAVAGEPVGSRRATVDAGGRTTVAANATLPAGSVSVSAGGVEQTVGVAGKRDGGGSDGGSDARGMPGFGVVGAVVAVAVAMALARRRT
ncbi:hypothetical protein [Halostella salina]|uniref:hypothetical protein n=1 Tax=Halostella salina TaxID=1547897 RepID=UPI000EF81E6F|nr:hypothetical protein [Halostella salina]